MVLLSLSRWLRKKAAWRRFWTNAAVFFVLQAAVLALKLRLASLAPDLEPPLDYRPAGYSPDDALGVMRGYGPEARGTAIALEVTDCLYSLAYTLLFASLLGLALNVIGARDAVHALNLVPAATAAVDVTENALMLALLADPRGGRSGALAATVAPVSAVKWRLLLYTASLIGGTGAFCLYKALKDAGRGGRRKGGGAKGVAAASAPAATAAEGGTGDGKARKRRA